MQIFLDIVLVILAVDFGSGLLHWLEDSYGYPDWPITGKWVTAPNILHHQAPGAFTRNSWLRSATVILIMGAIVITGTWLVGMLTWQVLLFVAIGVNANEIHKWNHLPRKRRGPLVVALQNAGLLQSAKHHGKHHLAAKDTHYCVVTNLLNPVLDAVRFWRGLEWAIERLLGVSKRPSPDAVLRLPSRHREGGAVSVAVAGRIAVCATLLMALSAQTTQQWGSELALPGMSTLHQAVIEDSEIVWYAEPFAGADAERYTATDETALWEVLVYHPAPYRAEIIYWKNRPGYSLIYTVMGTDPSNPTGWEYFEGKRITPDGAGTAMSPVGEIRYKRFLIPEAACFRFQYFWEYGSTWEERTRMLGGYVCKADAVEFPHAEISDLLGRLGVRGKEPDAATAPNTE